MGVSLDHEGTFNKYGLNTEEHLREDINFKREKFIRQRFFLLLIFLMVILSIIIFIS